MLMGVYASAKVQFSSPSLFYKSLATAWPGPWPLQLATTLRDDQVSEDGLDDAVELSQ